MAKRAAKSSARKEIAPVHKKPGRKRKANDPRAIIAASGLTTLQQRYLDELLEQVQAGRWLTDAEMSKRVHIHRATLSRWKCDPAFRMLASQIARSGNEFLADLTHRAVLVRGIQGSIKHAELGLAASGRLGGGYGVVDPERPPSGTVQQLGPVVNFYGLPQPPTPEQARALNPAPGSAIIVSPVKPGG